MTIKRLWQTMHLWIMRSSVDRVNYLKKNHIFGYLGENVTIMDRRVPLYANLIKIHNNVRIGSNVLFVTHDATHLMLNKKYNAIYPEVIGCIESMDNVFIGANVTILNDVRIGSDSIVAAGTVVTKDVPPNSVVAGVPARKICSFDEYLSRRKSNYPIEFAPRNQEVSDKLAKILWNDFNKRHEND